MMLELLKGLKKRVEEAEAALKGAVYAPAISELKTVVAERKEALNRVLNAYTSGGNDAQELEKLRAFKVYTHKRLDEAGVPEDPDGPHKAEGCRIGGRLDIVLDAYLNTKPHNRLADAKPETVAALKKARIREAAPKCEACGEPMDEAGACTRSGCVNCD